MENQNERYLAHHGIDGQKWGVKHGPPYPLSSKVSAAVKKHKLKSAAKKAKKEEKASELYAKRKDKALKSGSASDVLKYKGELTLQELRDAVNRLSMEKKLSEISEEELDTGEKLFKAIKTSAERFRIAEELIKNSKSLIQTLKGDSSERDNTKSSAKDNKKPSKKKKTKSKQQTSNKNGKESLAETVKRLNEQAQKRSYEFI